MRQSEILNAVFRKLTGRIAQLILAAVVTVVFAAGAAAPAQAAKYAGIVIDANSGKILYNSDADGRRYPASLTKMMTLYLVFEALESGRIKKSTRVTMSAHAAKEPPSKLGIRAGGTFTIEQGILALVTRSANDVATALGEFLAGSESKFGKLMTAKARSLGMKNTVYYNAHGLPDNRQVTTARDQAILSLALRQHFPQYYGYFSTRSFKFGKQVIGNHNRLLGKVRGVDGIKTGYTRAAGFNLATSARADGRSIVVVVLGGKTGRSRNAQVTELVQRYLPKASTRRSSNRIAKVSSGSGVVANARESLPAVGPVPQFRYIESPVAVADAAVVPMQKFPEAVVPTPAPAFVPAEKHSALAQVDDVVTGSTPAAPQGWVIQIGAAESPDDAAELLRNAQNKGGKVLRSATPFTMPFDHNGAKVYRARFAGFNGQAGAVNACKSLKRLGIGCWASQQ